MTALDDKATARNEGQAAANVPNRSGSTEAPPAPRPADALGGAQGGPRPGRSAAPTRDTHPHPDAIASAMAADHGDAFGLLGPHQVGPGVWEVRAILPEAKAARLITAGQSIPFERVHPDGFYVASVKSEGRPLYEIEVEAWDGTATRRHDPYGFGPSLEQSEIDGLRQIGRNLVYRVLGANAGEIEGIEG